MSNSMGEINKAIRELRRELCEVHGDATSEKRAKCMEIIDTITFHVLGKLLIDAKPEDNCNEVTLHDLTRST
jgi:hypothetical protein